jgi:membrane dipeptidase
MLVGPDGLCAAEIDPRVAQIVSRTIGVDMHSHVRPRYVRNPADIKPDPDIDLAGEIRRSGFSALCQTYDVDTVGKMPPGVYYDFNLLALGFEDRMLKRSRMRRALTLKDLETAHAQRQPIIVQSCEGAQFIEGRLERLEESYKRGLRNLQIVHDQDDAVTPLGDIYTVSTPHLGGLTAFGAEVIRACNRMGILVDLAHGTDATVKGALKVAAEPMLISHTSMSKDADNPDMRMRAISKDLAREVAGAGGVVGVWRRGYDSLEDYVLGIKVMVDALGTDHVGIGTDTDITSSFVLPYTNKIWTDQGSGLYFAVVGEMLKQGFTPIEIGKIGGGNFCRVFDKATAGHA